MNTPQSKWCLVHGCKRPFAKMWMTDMHGKPDIPVCAYHFGRRLWWYKGWIFCRDEEPQ
jgi:hypothetical protein